MANFAITNNSNFTGQNNQGTGYNGLIAIAASSGSMANPPTITGLRRGKIYDILIGTNGTPADNFIEWEVVRATVGSSPVWIGSISSVSSQFALDSADGGFAAFATVNTSVTSTAAFTIQQQLFYIGVNQRASYRWVAAPGSELIYPAVSSATGSNGLVLASRSAGYSGTVTGTVLFAEQ